MTGTGGREEGHDSGALLAACDEANLILIAPCHTAINLVSLLFLLRPVFPLHGPGVLEFHVCYDKAGAPQKESIFRSGRYKIQ